MTSSTKDTLVKFYSQVNWFLVFLHKQDFYKFIYKIFKFNSILLAKMRKLL